jgi:hypothetical protein
MVRLLFVITETCQEPVQQGALVIEVERSESNAQLVQFARISATPAAVRDGQVVEQHKLATGQDDLFLGPL